MAVCLNDLGDGFITFPEFQRQLLAIEAKMMAPKPVISAAKGVVLAAPLEPRFIASTVVNAPCGIVIGAGATVNGATVNNHGGWYSDQNCSWRTVGTLPTRSQPLVLSVDGSAHLVPDGMAMEEAQRIWGHR